MTRKDKIKELVGRSLGSYHTRTLQQIDRIEKKNKEQNHKISILTNELDNDYLTKTEEGSVVSLEHSKEGMVYLDELQGNTLVNYCIDGSKELTLNGDINVEGTNITLTEGVNNGLVDVICEGNTMVNIASVGSEFLHKNVTSWYRDVSLCEISSLKLNQNYTFIIEKEYLDNHNNNFNEFQVGIGSLIDTTSGHPTMTVVSGNFKYNNDKIEKKVVVVRFTDFKDGKYLSCRPVRRNTAPVEGESANYHIKVIILEGDWTNKEIPPYFESMKSVGELEDNKIEILSQSKNLFNGFTEQGNLQDNPPNDNLGNLLTAKHMRRSDYIKVQGNSQYIIGNFNSSEVVIEKVLFFDINKKAIQTQRSGAGVFTTPINCSYVKFVFKWSVSSSNTMNQSHIDSSQTYLLKGNVAPSQYVNGALNKKEISLNEPLRALPNGVKDKIIKIGGKHYVERNCGEVILDGSKNEYILGGDYSSDSIITIAYTVRNNASWTHSDRIICDRFVGKTGADSVWLGKSEGITSDVSKILIGISKSKLSSLDNNGVRQWLQQNPTTVIYALETPTYEEITDPTLLTYSDATHISNNSTIPCNMRVQNTGYNAIIKPSTLYTVALDTNKSGTIGINLGGAKITTTNNVATVTTPAILTDDSLRLYGKGIKGSKVRLLEGDKTNWIPSYFEGMKSSFEDKLQEDGTYKMEILSNNKNLLNWTNVKVVGFYGDKPLVIEDGFKGGFGVNLNFNEPLILGSGSYTFSYNFENNDNFSDNYYFAIHLEDVYGLKVSSSYPKCGKPATFKISKTSIISRIIFDIRTSSTENLYTNFQFKKETIQTEFIPHESNKIQFSSIEPLRGIGDVKDRFVFKDGKLMIERNFTEITLSGSESWKIEYTRYWTNLWDKNPNIKGRQSYYKLSNYYCIYNDLSYGNEIVSNGTRWGVGANFMINHDNAQMGVDSWKTYLSNNNIKLICELKEPTYEEIPFELQKIILEGYENGTLFFDTNIPPTVTTTYAGETPIVKATRLNKTEVLNNTNDINDNIVPYLMDMDYRVVCLQLEGGIENVSMARLFGGTYEMLQRDILSNRYSKEEYKYRLDAYLSANKITHEEYTKLGDMLND